MTASKKVVEARNMRNQYVEFKTYFVRSKGNRNYMRFAKRRANRLERQAGRLTVIGVTASGELHWFDELDLA